jgi:hypothetical protein
MKLDLKRMSGAICGPGKGKKDGSCTPSGNSRGAFSSSKRVNKTEGYKPPKGKIKFDEEGSPDKTSGTQEKNYERDFPGDVAPSGFGGGEGKKGTRFRTVEKAGIKYAGQQKNYNETADMSVKEIKSKAKKDMKKSPKGLYNNAERFKNNLGLPNK